VLKWLNKLSRPLPKLKRVLKNARQEANEIVTQAKKEASSLVEQAESKAKARAESVIANAEEEINKNIANARKTIHNEAIELVAMATEKVLGTVVDDKVDQSLIAESVKESV
jgi:F-type H+-transporting ATPase subunit b